MKIKATSILQAIVTFAALCLCAFAVQLTTGCKTTPTPKSIETKSYIVTKIVATKALQKHPNWIENFEIARDDLRVLAIAEQIGVEQITAIVTRLPADALGKEDTALYIEAGILFFSDELGAVAIDNPELARAAAKGMVRALDQVLPTPGISAPGGNTHPTPEQMSNILNQVTGK